MPRLEEWSLTFDDSNPYQAPENCEAYICKGRFMKEMDLKME
jgi:hypothetical protein